ncbi:RDD family protein [Nocardioides terrisoli]|uniref:RDD family protein n=1 Tax=Nocardioides terrisoli TaxID=3388267 RepID=UPI00287BA313|nr:RDD family protein [Nocardioides marmorisolisilvae]
MSDQTPPPDPPPYPAQPGPPSWGDPTYPPPPMPAYYQPPSSAYAHWGQRVGAYLMDGVVFLIPFYIVVFIGAAITGAATTTTVDSFGNTTSHMSGAGAVGIVVMVIGYAGAAGFVIWNQIVRQGRTGWSLGKRVVGIRLISERTGQPIGGWMCFVRYLAHILDALPCYIGYLWPLWDQKRQTFADKIIGTVVIPQQESSRL